MTTVFDQFFFHKNLLIHDFLTLCQFAREMATITLFNWLCYLSDYMALKTIAFLSFLIIHIGCKEISFQEPQPKGRKSLAEIPKKLQGTYLLTAVGDDSQDTLFVRKNGYLIASDKKESLLGDSLVLKQYKGYYFININENPEWLMRVIRQDENGDLTYMSMDEVTF